MRIAGTIRHSLVNGEGIRYVVFVQGCAHHCPGCHNPETWDFAGGEEISPKQLASMIKSCSCIDGVTLSGGDPFYQQDECMELMSHLPPDMNLWIYTGFLYEEIKDTPLAKRADVIVDGPFIEELKCSGEMRGSSNQRFIYKENAHEMDKLS